MGKIPSNGLDHRHVCAPVDVINRLERCRLAPARGNESEKETNKNENYSAGPESHSTDSPFERQKCALGLKESSDQKISGETKLFVRESG